MPGAEVSYALSKLCNIPKLCLNILMLMEISNIFSLANVFLKSTIFVVYIAGNVFRRTHRTDSRSVCYSFHAMKRR